MSETTTKAFEGWAILELMGHRRLAGHVTEVEIAGQGFLRLDVPETGDDAPAVTQFYSPAAVYALTPTTEEMARAVRSRPAPVHAYEVPLRHRELVSGVAVEQYVPEHERDEDEAADDGDYTASVDDLPF